jgi:alkylation response protein AidB-like acyl-CoA dehydrogenase
MTIDTTAGAVTTALREPLDGDAVLANVRAILPIIEAEAAEGERIGHLTERANAALLRAGVYRAGFARRRGGPELSLAQQTRMVEMIATVDAGTSWNAAVLAATGFYAGRLGDAAYAELYPHLDLPTAGSFHPRGRADVVAGGYRVTGTWSFGSGIHSSCYVLGGCLTFADGKPVLKDDGSQLVLGAWLPTEDVTILDDWHVIGLRASGSSAYRVTDRFVPAGHTFDRYFAPDPCAEPLNKLVDLPFYSMAGIAIGLSQHAVDLATDSLRARSAAGERQLGLLGEAESLLRAVRAVVYEGVRRIDDAIFTEGMLPSPAIMARGDAAVATDLARRIVDLCAEIVGSRLVYESFPMGGVIRDLVGLTAHASTWRSRWVDVGRTVVDDRS